MTTLKELTEKIKKISKVDENVYYNQLFKKERKRVCLSFYYFNMRSFHCGTFLVYLSLDYTGKILGTRLGDEKELEDYKGLIGTTIDLTTLGKYEKDIHDGPKNLNETKVLGEITSNGTVKMFTKKDYLNPKVVDKQDVNNKSEAPANKEYVSIYRAFTKKFCKQVTSCNLSDDHGKTWNAYFKVKDVTFVIHLWLFFDYHLNISVWREEGGAILTLAANKTDPKDFLGIVEEIISKKESNITKVLCATTKHGYDSRSYTFRPEKNGVELDIKFGGAGEPCGKYTFKFDLNKKKVRCLDAKKSVKFIPNEVKRFRKRLQEL